MIPFLIGVEKASLTGPLKQFQSLTATRPEALRLVKAINSALPSPIPDSIFERRFDVFWPELAGILEDVAASVDIPKPSSVSAASLQQQLADTTEMLREIVSAWNTTSNIEKQNSQSKSFLDEMLPFEGMWVDSIVKTHAYFQCVGEELYAPYCFCGNDSLTGVFYDWKRLSQYWFAKFQWLSDSETQGFILLTPETQDKLTGAWWLNDTQEDVLSIAKEGIDSHEDGQQITLIRQPMAQMPKWADQYFKQLESQSPYENPFNINTQG